MGSLRRRLAGVTKIGVDTAPFIYHFEENPTYLPIVRDMFGHVDNSANQAKIYTSGISLLEALIYPLKKQDEMLINRYRTFFLEAKRVELIPVTEAVFLAASVIRAHYNLRTPDALQLGACIQHGCEVFITNDRRLKRVSEIDVLVLADYIH